ncbi:transmembrane protein 180 isoform X1 [Varanus komodoensis]|uniref:Major facilitator superfamily domain containing 13A n=2 Tax=Varanus komodoensis TaxID=61221 RepID=A0A8D2LFP3_VARKO|nr:transmembrane protein 180 isoform X1 [Varanus komodoensis]XP_044293440.1 transmembrane protein 180 isoform X1 [Varanus komodoensis]
MGFRLLACLLKLPVAVVYGSLSLFVSILHNVFLLYYVDTFVSIYKIDKLSFWIGETVFLIWNSLNDPLFGWLSDRVFLSTQQSGVEISTPEVVLKRLRALSQNGPLFAMSFLAFWIAWAPPGLQFLICLCLYDSFLTMVDLNQNALLADLAVSAKDRTGLNFYSSLFSAIGSFSVFTSYAVWNKEDFFSFRIFCVVLACCSAAGFSMATWLLKQRFQTEGQVRWDDNAALKELCINRPSGQQQKRITLADYLKQLSRHRNFLWFVSMNLIQVFHCHFNSNFFPLFLEHLLSDHISLSVGSFLLGVSYVAPHLNNLYFLSLCQRWGVYAVVRGLFFLKLLLSVIMLLAGPDWVCLLCFFIASNRVFTEGTCKLLNLVVTDLVDEDLVLNRRQQAASALLFGMVALVTKPGQTFAPLIGTWLLCTYTGYDIFQQDPLSNIVSAQPKLPSNTASEPTLRQGCFYLLVFVPITCALLQLLSWSQFSLHGKRLQIVKSQRQTLTDSQSQDIKTI